MALIGLFARPILYYPVLAYWTGHLTSAILLSQLLQRTHQSPEGWVPINRLDFERETGLTKREQDAARADLKGIGLLDEKLVGMPARMVFRVRTDRLMELAREFGFGGVCGKVPCVTDSVTLELQNLQHKGKKRRCHDSSGEKRRHCCEGKAAKKRQTKLSLLESGSVQKAGFIPRCCLKLETFIRQRRKLMRPVKVHLWANEMRKLLEELEGDKKRLKHVLETYTQTYDPNVEEFRPQADSASGFRKKFPQIERWAAKYGKEPPRKKVLVFTEGEVATGKKGRADAIEEIPD